MHSRLYNHIKNLLAPCLAFSLAAGILSAILITAFKTAAELVIHLSNTIYGAVRSNHALLPLLILGTAALGLLASVILSFSRSCRGGGIPTSVAAIRGILSFRWIAGVIILPFSALLTFLCGIPLGSEGPCVQMGTAIGDGVVKCFGKEKHRGWRRYIMTGGASAGFSIATASPITAIIFSMEELHKHFSPLLLTVASLSVLSAQITSKLLAFWGFGSTGLFEMPEINTLELKMIFVPIIIGLAAGLVSILFTHFYHFIDRRMRYILKKLSTKIVFPVIFAIVSIVGFFMANAIGSGHKLVDELFRTQVIWYMIIIIFLLRVVGMMVSNTSGVTGGVFLPTLAFGALTGSLCAEIMIAFGWIGEELYVITVVLGITAFLGASSRIPITACVFAVEALACINNILPVIIATIIALLVVEISGLEDFTDTVVEANIHSLSNGKKPELIEATFTVTETSFVANKDLRDVFWPNSCIVISFERLPINYGKHKIAVGDIVTVRYSTYDIEASEKELRAFVGEESEISHRTINANKNISLIAN